MREKSKSESSVVMALERYNSVLLQNLTTFSDYPSLSILCRWFARREALEWDHWVIGPKLTATH